jgi:hypothetical protein
MRDVVDAGRACEADNYPPARISAQLRHLRKPEYWASVVEKRLRKAGRILRGEDFGAVWEYQLMHRIRRSMGRARRLRAGIQRALRPAVS